MSEENKKYLDGLNHYGLLSLVRFAKSENPLVQDETGKYLMLRYAEERDKDPQQAVRDSKDIGWN